jgi:hypothetical protein
MDERRSGTSSQLLFWSPCRLMGAAQRSPWNGSLNRGTPVSADLTPYELRVLRSHQYVPRRESELVERKKAQSKLLRRGYLKLADGVYTITPDGRYVLESSK